MIDKKVIRFEGSATPIALDRESMAPVQVLSKENINRSAIRDTVRVCRETRLTSGDEQCPNQALDKFASSDKSMGHA